MIRIDRAFVLFATCSISYNGRASSSLVPGNYLITRKGDGTLLIHGASRFNPLNFQTRGAISRLDGDMLVSTRKNEIIAIKLEKIIHYYELPHWSDNRIVISMTEDELKNSIFDNLEFWLGEKVAEKYMEHPTPYGPIDIFAVGASAVNYVIEVKRAKASLASCAQLERYLGYYKEIKKDAHGWLMSPGISSGALKYCESHNLKWLKVMHRNLPAQPSVAAVSEPVASPPVPSDKSASIS